MANMIWIYSFEDGTTIKLLNEGLSTAEIWKLQEMHGGCVIRYEYL